MGEFTQRRERMDHIIRRKKRIDQMMDHLKNTYDETADAILTRLDADKIKYEMYQEIWSTVKMIADTIIITTASAFGGLPAGLITKGILQLDPASALSGIFSDSYIGPTAVTGQDGSTYYSTNLIPKLDSFKDQLGFRSHQLLDAFAPMLKDLAFSRNEMVMGDPGSPFDGQMPAPSKMKKLDRYFDTYETNLGIAIQYGPKMFSSYILGNTLKDSIYNVNFKYFYLTKAGLGKGLNLDILDKAHAYMKGTETQQNRKAYREVQRRYNKSKDQWLKRFLEKKEYRILFENCSFKDYKSDFGYDQKKIDNIRLHKAGFMKYSRVKVRGRGPLLNPFSHDAQGSLTRKSKVDLIDLAYPGDTALKAYMRMMEEDDHFLKTYKIPSWEEIEDLSFEETLELLKPNPNRRHIHMKKQIHNKAFRKSKSKLKHWGQNNPARWMLGKVKSSWGTSSSEFYRKKLYVSWLIIYRMLEVHTGFPFPLLMPPESSIYRQYQYAIADILDLACRIPVYASDNRKPWQNPLFVTLMGTPGILEPYIYRRVNRKTKEQIPTRRETIRLLYEMSSPANEKVVIPTKKYENKYKYKTWGFGPIRELTMSTIMDLRKNRSVLKERAEKIKGFFQLPELYDSKVKEFDLFKKGRQKWNIHKDAGEMFDKSLSRIYQNLELHMQGRVSTIEMFNLILESLASIRKVLRRLDKNIDKEKAFKNRKKQNK